MSLYTSRTNATFFPNPQLVEFAIQYWEGWTGGEKLWKFMDFWVQTRPGKGTREKVHTSGLQQENQDFLFHNVLIFWAKARELMLSYFFFLQILLKQAINNRRENFICSPH